MHEVAPDATLLLYRLDYNGQGTVTPAAIKAAIRHAADQGAKVILVPLHFIRTMSDPQGPGGGRHQPLHRRHRVREGGGRDGRGTGGQRGAAPLLRQVHAVHRLHRDTLCNTANNDKTYHVFDDDLPLNDLILDSDYDDFAYNDGETFNVGARDLLQRDRRGDPEQLPHAAAALPRQLPARPIRPTSRAARATRASTVVVRHRRGPRRVLHQGPVDLQHCNFDDYYFLAVKRCSPAPRSRTSASTARSRSASSPTTTR